MGGVTGDFAKIARWRRNMERMIGVPQRAARVVAPIFQAQLQSGFDSKTDPYGNAWKDISAATLARGTKSILERSGVLRSAVGAMAAGLKVKVFFSTPYAKFYISTGRGIVPLARKIPDTWKVTIKREVSRAFTEIAEGRS